VIGRKGIEEWGDVATKVWNHLEIQQGRCSDDGNVVWEQGTWTGNINLADQQTMDISGNFLLVAEKERKAPRCASRRTRGTLTRQRSDHCSH
jgi:hypothetical protein